MCERFGASPFDKGQTLHYMLELMPELVASLKDATVRPQLKEFSAVQRRYEEIFDEVMRAHQLDVLVFPQSCKALPVLFSEEKIEATTVSAINIAGLPAITVPAGVYASNGSCFGLMFVGRKWSEPQLIGFAFDFEQQSAAAAAVTKKK